MSDIFKIIFEASAATWTDCPYINFGQDTKKFISRGEIFDTWTISILM